VTIEEAIRMSVIYETKVRAAYADAAENSRDETGRRVFAVLEREEEGHIEYLNNRLEEWIRTGEITLEALETVIPAFEVIDNGVSRLDDHMTGAVHKNETDMLETALKLEIETSDFYRKMVEEMGEEGKLFARFLEIEEGHQALVQAELDYLKGSGFFFDYREFSLEQ